MLQDQHNADAVLLACMMCCKQSDLPREGNISLQPLAHIAGHPWQAAAAVCAVHDLKKLLLLLLLLLLLPLRLVCCSSPTWSLGAAASALTRAGAPASTTAPQTCHWRTALPMAQLQMAQLTQRQRSSQAAAQVAAQLHRRILPCETELARTS